MNPIVEHVRPDGGDEHIGSKKLKFSAPGNLPTGAPMRADVNLSSDDMRVECLLELFERERVSNTSNNPMLNRITGEVSDEQFSGGRWSVDRPARSRVAHDLLKPVQSQNDVHVEYSSTCHAVAGTWMFKRTLTICVNTCELNDQCSSLDRRSAWRSWNCSP